MKIQRNKSVLIVRFLLRCQNRPDSLSQGQNKRLKRLQQILSAQHIPKMLYWSLGNLGSKSTSWTLYHVPHQRIQCFEICAAIFWLTKGEKNKLNTWFESYPTIRYHFILPVMYLVRGSKSHSRILHLFPLHPDAQEHVLGPTHLPLFMHIGSQTPGEHLFTR